MDEVAAEGSVCPANWKRVSATVHKLTTGRWVRGEKFPKIRQEKSRAGVTEIT